MFITITIAFQCVIFNYLNNSTPEPRKILLQIILTAQISAVVPTRSLRDYCDYLHEIFESSAYLQCCTLIKCEHSGASFNEEESDFIL